MIAVQLLALASLLATIVGFGSLTVRWWRIAGAPQPIPPAPRARDAEALARAVAFLVAVVATGDTFWALITFSGLLVGAGYGAVPAPVWIVLFFAMQGFKLWAGWRMDVTMRRVLR